VRNYNVRQVLHPIKIEMRIGWTSLWMSHAPFSLTSWLAAVEDVGCAASVRSTSASTRPPPAALPSEGAAPLRPRKRRGESSADGGWLEESANRHKQYVSEKHQLVTCPRPTLEYKFAKREMLAHLQFDPLLRALTHIYAAWNLRRTG